jgi:energy-converting hydrogenase Eha subunit A
MNESPAPKESAHDAEDFTDMLSELRVLLPGAQLLNVFLITLPFSSGFKQIVQAEKWVFMGAFVFSIISLILFTAPAVQHRLMRPLLNRRKFKHFVTWQMLAGALALSIALILGAYLVMSEVLGHVAGALVAGFTAVLITVLWWALPRAMKC